MELAEQSLIGPILPVALDSAGPPQIAGYPVLGALPELLQRHHGALDRWFEAGGDVFEVPLAGMKLKFIARGEIAAEALLGNRECFVRSPIFNDAIRQVTGDSVLTLEGGDWRQRRRALQPKFHARVMMKMMDRVSAALDEVLSGLEPGRVNLASLCDRLTMSIGLRVMFGHTLTDETFEELAALSPIVISRIAVGWVTSKLPKWLPLPGEARFRRSLARIDEIVLDMVTARRESGELGDDLLGTLLHMVEEDLLDDRGVRDEAVTMLLAGYETTSNSLAWTLHSLATHPQIVAKIRAEANAVLGEDDESGADVRKLEYSLRCVKEGLRLHPAAMWLMRLATQDTKVGGYDIAAGDTIVCSTHLIHRNPKDWADPTRFDPDRFKGELPPHAFIPFGIGQHMCIGKHLALFEGQLILAKLFQRWDLTPVSDHTARKRISTTLSNADGIFATLSRATTA